MEQNNFSKVKIFGDSLRTLQSVIDATIYYNPFKFFLLISIILLLTSIISAFIYYYLKIKLLKTIFFIFLIIGVLSLLLGFISTLLKKID